LSVEELEARFVPSTVNWIGGTGDWATPRNWLDTATGANRLPGAADDVVIRGEGGAVTVSSDVGTIHSLNASLNLTITNGALTISSASSVSGSAILTISGGTLTLGSTGTAGTLSVGTFNQSGGTLTGPGEIEFKGGVVSITDGQLTTSVVSFSGADITVSGGSFHPTDLTVFTGSSATFTVASNLTTLSLAGGTLKADSDFTVSGNFFWSSGAISGSGSLTVGPSGSLFLENSAKTLDGRLVNASPVTVAWAGGDVTGTGSFSNQAGSTFLALGDGTFAPLFSNDGTFIRALSGGTVFMGGVNNSGTLDVRSGLLQLSGPLTQTDGSMHLNGGSVQAPLFDLQGGQLDGIGTLTGDVTNNATIAPGYTSPVPLVLPTFSNLLVSTIDKLTVSVPLAPATVVTGPSVGVITIDGNFTQGPAGVLEMKIAGSTPGVTQDQLVISGNADLGGTMSITTLAGFTPSPGGTITLMTAGNALGSFDAVTGLAGAGFAYTPIQTVISFDVGILAQTSSTTSPTAAGLPAATSSVVSSTHDVLAESPLGNELTMSPASVSSEDGLIQQGLALLTGTDLMGKYRDPIMVPILLPRDSLVRFFAEGHFRDESISTDSDMVGGDASDDDAVGTIQGQVFTDIDADGVQSEDELPREGQGVYLDLNRNGVHDEGEPYTETNSAGEYKFEGLVPGVYSVRLDLTRRADQTTPAEPAYTITITPMAPTVNGINFGVKDRRLLRQRGETRAPAQTSPLPYGAWLLWFTTWGARVSRRRKDS
jgi:hypothetical protein